MSIGIGVQMPLKSPLGNAGNPVMNGLIGEYQFGWAKNLRPNADGSGSNVTHTQQIKWVKDLSGKGNHLILSTANGPTWQQNTYLGRGCGRFNATALTTAANIGITNNECTMVFLGNITSMAGANAIIMVATTNYTTAGSNWFGISGAGSVYKLEASGGVVDLPSTMSCVDSKLHVFSAALKAGSSPLKTIRSDGNPEWTDAPGASYNIVDNRLSLGGFNTADYFVGDCCAALVYNRQLTQAELSKLELYLANLYGKYLTGVTWPTTLGAINRASVVAGQINHNQLGTAADPLTHWYDGENIDELGTNNASLTDGTTQATWKNLGSAAGGGDATQATDANRPVLQKNLQNGQDAMVFGGNFDILSIAGSQADLAFIHNTNNWSIFGVIRKDLANRQVILSNTDLLAELGFVLDFDDTGKFHIKISKGGTIVKDIAMAAATPVGDIVRISAEGMAGATGVRVNDIAAAGSNASAPGGGNATNLAQIGCLASTASGSFDGPMFILLIFNKNVPSTEKELIHNYFKTRFNIA